MKYNLAQDVSCSEELILHYKNYEFRVLEEKRFRILTNFNETFENVMRKGGEILVNVHFSPCPTMFSIL